MSLLESKVKNFSLKEESMYDMDTYIGRSLHFARITDVRMISVNDEKLAKHIAKLNDFKNHPGKYDLSYTGVNKDLWYSKYCIKSATNQETGEKLPLPVRMSAYLPMSIPISFGLLVLPPTKFNLFLFNFLNQSYNSVVNYYNSSNRDKSIKYFTICYFLAVFSSVGTGFYLNNLFARKSQSLYKEILIRLLPSAVPGALNILLMRSDYVLNGVNIKDSEHGNVLGVSRVAGLKALFESAFTRFFLPFLLIIFVFIVKYWNSFNLPKNLKLLGQIGIVGLGLSVSLPCSIAVFKQFSGIRTSYLEANLKINDKIRELDYIYYNKGL